jgi:hypothetical protein
MIFEVLLNYLCVTPYLFSVQLCGSKINFNHGEHKGNHKGGLYGQTLFIPKIIGFE